MRLLAVLFLALSLAPSQTITSQQAEALAQATRMMLQWGPSISTAGHELTLKETRREKRGEQWSVTYQMYAHGFGPGEKLELLAWEPLREPQGMLSGITIVNGRAVCAGRPDTCGTEDKPDDPIDAVFPVIPGEAKFIALSTADGKRRAAARVIPVPVTTTDRGCTLSVFYPNAGAEIAVIEGSGFRPKSTVKFQSNSEGESKTGSSEIGDNGKYYTVVLPWVKGKTGGSTKVRVENEHCSPELTFLWGKRQP